MSQWMLEPLQNAADEACEEPEGGAWVGAPASRSLQLPRIEIKESNSFFILAVRERGLYFKNSLFSPISQQNVALALFRLVRASLGFPLRSRPKKSGERLP